MINERKVDHGTVTYLEKIQFLGKNLLSAHTVWVNDNEVSSYCCFYELCYKFCIVSYFCMYNSSSAKIFIKSVFNKLNGRRKVAQSSIHFIISWKFLVYILLTRSFNY